MTTDGGTIHFSYDHLKRLETRTAPVLKTKYSYRDLSTTRTTTQVAKMEYLHPTSGSTVLPALSYSYDGMGNITKVQPAGEMATEYTYDAQNQLAMEQTGTTLYTYIYDTYGNVRNIYYDQDGLGGNGSL